MKSYIHIHVSHKPSDLEKYGFVEKDRKLLFASVYNSGAWETAWKDVGINDGGGYRTYVIDVKKKDLTTDTQNPRNKVLVISKKNQKEFNKDVEYWFKNQYTGNGIGGHNVFYHYMVDRQLLGVDFTSHEARYPDSVYDKQNVSPGEAIFVKNPGCIWLKEVCKAKRFNAGASPFVICK